MKTIAATAVIITSLALTGPAVAHPPSSETITSTISLTSFPSAAPYRATYAGTFTTSTGDSGSEIVAAQLGAVPSPATGVVQTQRTLTSDDGRDTLVLRCHQFATTQDFATYPLVPDSGSCAVLSATGTYSGLSGSGALSGAVEFDPSGASGTLMDTVTLGG